MSFVAGELMATFTLVATGCTIGEGLQLGLYTACGSGPIACNGGFGAADEPVLLENVPLVLGQTYHLVVDGYNGDVCNFNVTVAPQSAMRAPLVGATAPIHGPTSICPGGTAVYQVDNTFGASQYTWNAPPDALINGASPPLTLSVNDEVSITFGGQGGLVSVVASNACHKSSTPATLEVKTVPTAPTVLKPVDLCPGGSYTLPWGQVARATPTPGTLVYRRTYRLYGACDSVVEVSVRTLPPNAVNLGVLPICPGDSVRVCGQWYKTPGQYSATCPSWKGCDSVNTFSVVRSELEILGVGSLNCFNGAVPLQAGNNLPGNLVWKDDVGQTLATGNAYTATTPGVYTLELTQSFNGKTCFSRRTAAIKAVDTLRLSSATPALNCANPSLPLAGRANMPATFMWAGPSGFTAALPSPTVTLPGTYVLQAATSGGCTATLTTMVTADFKVPSLSVGGGHLNCTAPSMRLNAVTDAPVGALFQWVGPNNSSGNQPNPVVAVTGHYRFTVTSAANGCSATATATVTGDFAAPTLTATGANIICAAPNAQLRASTVPSTTTFAWTGPNNFASTLANPSVTAPGDYRVVATDSTNGCTAADTLRVELQNQPVPLVATGGTITCQALTVTLDATAPPVGATFVWAGPNGFTSILRQPTVSQAGTYSVTVTDPATGCTGAATCTVTGNATLPTAQAIGGEIGCAPPTLQLSCNTNAANATYRWAGPAGFTSTLRQPTVLYPGTYTVTVTNTATSCTRSAATQAFVNGNAPQVFLSLTRVGTRWRINCSTTAQGASFSWVGPNGFTSTLQNPLVSVPGTYHVLVNDWGLDCNGYASINVPPLTQTGGGAQDRAVVQGHWTLSPNPASEQLTLRYEGDGNLGSVHVQCFDPLGRLVREQDLGIVRTATFDVSDFPPGLYRLVLRTEVGVEVKGIVVE